MLCVPLLKLNEKNINFEYIVIYFWVQKKGGAQLGRGPQFETIWYKNLKNTTKSSYVKAHGTQVSSWSTKKACRRIVSCDVRCCIALHTNLKPMIMLMNQFYYAACNYVDCSVLSSFLFFLIYKFQYFFQYS